MTAKVMFAYHAAFGGGPMNCRILEQICICLETPWYSMHIAIMPEKQPKRSNNNAKELESWESEGGAPASEDGSTKGQRLRDLNQITKAQPARGHKGKPKRA
jgi:hypothetical protein